MKAIRLGHGTQLRTASSTAVTAIKGVPPNTTSGWMWDLTIPGDHDFYVSAGYSAAVIHGHTYDATQTGVAVLVHNCDSGEQTGETSDLLSNLAGSAQTAVGEGRGAVYGTAVHSEFAAEINALGNPDLTTEVSYLNGSLVPYGTRGSVRLDVVEGNILEPQAAYDLKTGSATLTQARIAQIQANLPPGYQDIPITEIRP